MVSRKIKPPQNPPKIAQAAKMNNMLSHRSIKEAEIEYSPANSQRQITPKKPVTPKKPTFRQNRMGKVEYNPTPAAKATDCIDFAMQFFKTQCLDDSDIVEGEYFIEVTHLPKTRAEADQMAQNFEDNALHWEYPEDEQEVQEVEEQPRSAPTMFTSDIYSASLGDKKDQKSGLTFPRNEPEEIQINGEQGQDEKTSARQHA